MDNLKDIINNSEDITHLKIELSHTMETVFDQVV